MNENRGSEHRSDRHSSFFHKTGAFFRQTASRVYALLKRAYTRVAALFGVRTKQTEQIEQTRRFDSVETLPARPKKNTPAPVHELPHISREHLSGEGKEHITMFTPRHRRPGFVISVLLTSFRLVLVVIFMIGAAGLGSLVGIAKAYMETTPTLDTAEIEEQAETSYLYDCNGELITMYTGTENRDWASLEEIPVLLQEAVISIEDVRFYYHSGVDLKRLVGAFISNLMNSNVQGGSTLTQQLIKNSLLSTERTYKRKIQEAYLAMQLEQEYDKDKILESYLNTVSFGGSNYGVKAAALDYFDKDLSQLSLRECAMLAGITQYPYKYNPRRCYYIVKDPSVINERTDNVLQQMYYAGYITEAEYKAALADSVYVLPESSVNEMYGMPYFVEYAVYDVITHFLEARGKEDTDANRAAVETELRTQGYRIYTTVDPAIQKTVEQCLADWDKYPKMKNSEDSVASYENKDGTVTDVIQPQAAFVVLDQKTGALKAVVGGRTTPEVKKTFNRSYQNNLPVGSSIKPIAVYGPAIDLGFSDGTVVPNLPVAIEGWENESGTGYPGGGAKYYGPVTLRTAMVQSLNSATAYTLLRLVGLDNSYNYLTNMGIDPAHISKTGSGLALGDSSITPIELAGAYGTIANSGVYLEPLSFKQVIDRDGNVILDADDIQNQNKRQVFQDSTAWLVADMLVNAVQKGTGKEARIDGVTVGGKTGTVQNATGVLFAGITPDFTATLWIGSDRYKPLAGDVYASSSAAPLWKYIMSKIYETGEYPNKGGAIIDADAASFGLEQAEVCGLSGMLATDACRADTAHPTVMAWYRKGAQPTEECDWHDQLYVCTESGKFAVQFCPQEQLVYQAVIFLEADSPYWKLTPAKREEYLGRHVYLKPSIPIRSITPDMPEYAEYYCTTHTEEWWNAFALRQAAIEKATAQIAESKAVLADSTLTIPLADRDMLSGLISELQTLAASSDATAGAIEQKTAALESLTNQLVALYSGPALP